MQQPPSSIAQHRVSGGAKAVIAVLIPVVVFFLFGVGYIARDRIVADHERQVERTAAKADEVARAAWLDAQPHLQLGMTPADVQRLIGTPQRRSLPEHRYEPTYGIWYTTDEYWYYDLPDDKSLSVRFGDRGIVEALDYN